MKLIYALYMGLNVRYGFLNNYLVNENGETSRPEYLFANLVIGVELE